MTDDRLLTLTCRVEPDDHGERLDVFLPAALLRQHGTELSRRAVRRALQAGSVYLGGKRIRTASRAVKRGDRVEIVLERSPDGAPRTGGPALPSKARPLSEDRILYEDRSLLVIDKPSGLPSQATRTDALGNALEQARALLRRRDGGDPYLVLAHRLDQGTSGCLLLVKDRRANKGLAEAFREGRVHKVYRLLVAPGERDPEEADRTVDLPLGSHGRRMEPDSLGQEAITEIQRVAGADYGHGPWLLEARPRTGRKHQIRAHLAAVGLPILGDRLYSPPQVAALAPRPMLHAFRLGLDHPLRRDKRVEVECPPPEDFERATTT